RCVRVRRSCCVLGRTGPERLNIRTIRRVRRPATECLVRSFLVKFHLKTWPVLSGVGLSLVLASGCSSEPTPEPTPPPAVKEGSTDAERPPRPAAPRSPAPPPRRLKPPHPHRRPKPPRPRRPRKSPRKRKLRSNGALAGPLEVRVYGPAVFPSPGTR